MSYWQLSDEEEAEIVRSRYDPIVKFSYTNPDKVVKPCVERKWTQNAYSVSDVSESRGQNNGFQLGIGSESFYSASTPYYSETHMQDGGTYTETHFNGSYDFQHRVDDSRKIPDMDGSFQGMFSPRDNSNGSTNNNKNILFKESTYEERQDEINRLLRNNAKNEKFIQDISDEVPQENNNSSLVSYRKFSNNIGYEEDCVSTPLKLRQPFVASPSEKICSTTEDYSSTKQKDRYSTDSETFDSEIFPKMTPIAVEKVKKLSVEILSEQSEESRAGSPIDFLSRRAKFESNNNSTDYKSNVYRAVKTTKTAPSAKPCWEKKGPNNYIINYQGNVEIPPKSAYHSNSGFSTMKSSNNTNKQTTSSNQTWFSSKPSQNVEQTHRSAVSTKTTTNMMKSHQRSNKENVPSYQKDVRERTHKTSTNLSRYGTSVQEEKLLRQATSSKKNEKTYADTVAAHDDDKSSDYESLSTSMETVIDCSSTKTPERCSSVDTGIHKISRYNKRVADIVRMFNEMEVKQHIPDGYYTWQEYKMRNYRGLSRWDDPSTNVNLSKSYSNINELQLADSSRSKSECNILELNSSYEAPTSQNWYRPKSVDVYESSRNDSRHQERSPLIENKLNYDITSSQEKSGIAQYYQSSASPNLVPNNINAQTISREKEVNKSLFHDERRSAFERHTPNKPEPEHTYENVSFSSTHSSKNNFQKEQTESSFINTQRKSNTGPSNEDGNNYYVTCTVMQSRLTPLGDLAKNTEQSRRSRASTRTESSLVDQKDKSTTSKAKVVTWGPNKTLTTSRFRSHSADPYEMTRKSTMGSKTASGSNMNLSSWRIASPEPSPHFQHLTAGAKLQAESYYVNSDQRLMNILFENLMENKYLNRSSKLKQNQDVVQQSKFIQDKGKEISQQNTANYVPMTKSTLGSSKRGIKSGLSEVAISDQNNSSLYSEEKNSSQVRTNIHDESDISKRSTIVNKQNITSLEKSLNTQQQASTTYGISYIKTSRCNSPQSDFQKRSCRLVTSPVNVGAATMSFQAETKPRYDIKTNESAFQKSKRLQFNRLSQSTDSLVGYPWREKKEMGGTAYTHTKRAMVWSPTVNSRSDVLSCSTNKAKREMVVSPSYNSRKREVWSPSYGSNRDLVGGQSYSKIGMVGSSSYNSNLETVGRSSYSSKREVIVSPSYDSRKDVAWSPSSNLKRSVVDGPSYISKREMIWSPSCNSSPAPYRVLSPASSIAFDERAFSPRVTSPFRVISPSQGNSILNMQTYSRSELALSARNTPQSESSVLRFIPSGSTEGMSDIEYRKQMYLKSVQDDSAPLMKYRTDESSATTVTRSTTQLARRI